MKTHSLNPMPVAEPFAPNQFRRDNKERTEYRKSSGAQLTSLVRSEFSRFSFKPGIRRRAYLFA